MSMKHVTRAVLALTLLAGAASEAQAQDGGRRGDWVKQGTPPRGDAPRPETPAAASEPRRERGEGERREWTSRRGDGDGNRRGEGEHRGDERGDRDWSRGDDRRQDRDRGDWNRSDRDRREGRDRDRRDWDRGDDRRDWDRRDWDRRDWNRRDWDRRDWGRQARPRYDRRYYPPVFRPARRYHVPVYRPPIGFYSRSWVFGEVLPRGWYGPEHRLLDWWDFGLPVPPVGYEWVRVGDDALLVDEFTGRIVQVVHNLFW